MEREEREHILEFLNPEMLPSLNVTVRLGHSWLRKATPGDIVKVKQTGESKTMYRGDVVGLCYIPFNMIPAEWLALEHDSSCRSLIGLERAMRRAYGEEFTIESWVTVILFDITQDFTK